VIAELKGTLAAKELERVTVMTAGGVGYELLIPLSVFETLPKLGDPVHLHTHLVVRDDGWLLFGFTTPFERQVFQLLLTANGVGPALALALVSHLTADRLVRALHEKDIATLQSVPRVGRKKAERMVLDLADKLDGLEIDATVPPRRRRARHARP
jgi:Holliday junction DNA helicase RuvA